MCCHGDVMVTSWWVCCHGDICVCCHGDIGVCVVMVTLWCVCCHGDLESLLTYIVLPGVVAPPPVVCSVRELRALPIVVVP